MPGETRIVTLDGLRGVAVMGILLMNINAFAMPFPAYDNPAAYGPMRWPDVALWAIELVLVDGKMRAIFSALFGASLLLVTDRAEASGRNPARVHFARMGTLLIFGLLHACLLWEGDILVLYALVGMAAFPLRTLPIERLLVLAGVLLLFDAAMLGLHYQALGALQHAATGANARPSDIAAWASVLDQIGRPRANVLAADLALHRGEWGRLATTLAGREYGSVVQQLLLNGPETLGLMALGMAGLRSGFLAGRWPATLYRRWAAIGFLAGVPPMMLMAVLLIHAGFPPLALAIATDLVAMPFRWMIGAALAAAIVGWLARGSSPLRVRIAAVGRTAFTNYLGTTLLMTALFDGWGLGLYGRVERWALLPFVLLAWVLMLAWIRPWLDRFAFGPLEWAWRSLARGRLARMRAAATSL